MGEIQDDQDATLEDLIDCFVDEPTDIETFVAQHPEHADELRRILPAMEAMDGAAKAFDSGDARASLDRHARWQAARERLAEGKTLSQPGSSRDSHGNGKERECSEGIAAHMLGRLEQFDDRVERYSREGEIGRGGQGAVLAVWDEKLQRHLAMKVALSTTDGEGSSDPRSLGRFLEEANVTAQLDHPGIVPLHDLGLDPDRRVYFTMKLVKGHDLRAVFGLVRSGEEGWTQTRALNVLSKVCEAMAYAHSKRVIHRDLKPSNVMVGKYGEVYVMDWGLARIPGKQDEKDIRIQTERTEEIRPRRQESPDDLDSPLITMDGDVVGTPAYMSPEQAKGDLEAMGPHSDVYAVGAMLYQLLTSEMPYVPSGSRLSTRAIWALVQKGPPDPVHERVQDVPVELIAICEKAMARDIRSRYRDMSELAEDLRAYLEHRVVSAYETGAFAELRKWVGRNKRLSSASAAAVFFLVIGLVVSLNLKARSDRDRANVMQLSAFQRLEELKLEADALWPPWPEHLDAYDEWLIRARELVVGLDVHRAQLKDLKARALPYTEQDREANRESHPRFVEFERLRAELGALERAQAVREGLIEVAEVSLDESSLSEGASGLYALARTLVDPERTVFGREEEGLALARLALERVADDQESIRASETLSWALLASGLDDEALSEGAAALSLAPESLRAEQERSMERLSAAVKEAREGALGDRIAVLRGEVDLLADEVARRRMWRFEREEDSWWHAQLVNLVEEIENFADLESGLITGISAEHGWGIKTRKEWAATTKERTVAGEEVARRWANSIASISDHDECPAYGRLVIDPQLGLLPVGRDPDSGLWEFAHPLSGKVPERDDDGQLELTEETGLVFVLLPGGTFSMGAQARAPNAPGYDPQAAAFEGPVHEVTLTPFFLSKYEMTQGQWQRFTSKNPSYFQPPSSIAHSLLHPVEYVTWIRVNVVCERMGLVVPTEAQWEYAARAGTTTAWWTGDDRESLVGAANLADQSARRLNAQWSGIQDWPELDDGYGGHAPVGRYAPNPFGLYDVLGNLQELCRDGFDPDYYDRSPVLDPLNDSADSSSCTTRGGGFRDAAIFLRSSSRNDPAKEAADASLGLRPARAIDP